jgi:hypothetical protein
VFAGGDADAVAAPLTGEVPRRSLGLEDHAYEMVGRRSLVSVQWKDGRVERDVPATSLRPYMFFNSYVVCCGCHAMLQGR